MSEDTRIINAITGKVVVTNIRYFTTYNDFKFFIKIKWGIPIEQILILLPYGTKLKQSVFESYLSFNSNNLDFNVISDNTSNNLTSSFLQKEFYVFDRRLFSMVNEPSQIKKKNSPKKSNDNTSKKEQLINDTLQKIREILKEVVSEKKVVTELSLIKPVPSPLIETTFKTPDSRSYHNVTSIVITNMGWLSALEIDVHYLEQMITDFSEDISNIVKCLFIANEYLKKYAFDVEQLYNSNVSFLDQLSHLKSESKWSIYYDNVLNKLDALNGSNLQQFVDKNKLQSDFKLVNELDTNVNSELLKIKKEIDTNFTERDFISDNIRQLENHFIPLNDNYKLEDEMLNKFNELIDKIKLEVRELLDQKMEDLSEGELDSIATNIIGSEHKSTVSKLHTISQALYTKVEDFLNQKHLLQEQTVSILGQVSFSQMAILRMKRILIHDCNTKLKLYQETIQHFTQVEDIPVIYGLYMMELYRQKLWFFNIVKDTNSFITGSDVRTDKEISMRADWIDRYGLVALLFTGNIKDTTDFKYLNERLSKGENGDDAYKDTLYNIKVEAQQLFSSINTYLQQLTETTINIDIYNSLAKNFQDMNSLNLALSNECPEDFESSESRIKYYRDRVLRLESILHDIYLNNSQQWPTGMLVMPVCSTPGVAIGNMVSTSSIQLPLFMNKDKNINDKTLDIAREEINNLTKKNDERQSEINKQNLQLTDLKLESAAYRETLNHLNQELFRLTTLQEEGETDRDTRTLEYKEGLEKLISQNIASTNEIQSLKDELEESNGAYKTLKVEMDKLSQDWANEREQLKFEIEQLKTTTVTKTFDNNTYNDEKQVDEYNSAIIDRNTINSSTPTNITADNISILTEPGPLVEPPIESSEHILLAKQNHQLQKFIFEIFQRNIYILENIGLLLTTKSKNVTNQADTIIDLSDKQLSIKRVKGLKKSTKQSMTSSYSLHSHQYQEDVNNKVIHSSVYHAVEELFHKLDSNNDDQGSNNVLDFIRRLYDSNLYDSSVIRRFNDVEILAKKLTKDLKSKKKILSKLQSEKITVKDFQVGDLALFLPTSDSQKLEGGYSISSLNSSFSSVDISTPPHTMEIDNIINNNSPNIQKFAITDFNEKEKARPWAAFTAFEKDVKYFYCNQGNHVNLRNEEWFLGEITSLEKNTVTTDTKYSAKGNNPYKLPVGTVWYDVKAQVIIHPIFE